MILILSDFTSLLYLRFGAEDGSENHRR
jgi:hypothetical protein